MLGVMSGSTAADAQTVKKLCADQWKAAEAAQTTNGETWDQFLAQCRAEMVLGRTAPAVKRSCAKSCDRCARICE